MNKDKGKLLLSDGGSLALDIYVDDAAPVLTMRGAYGEDLKQHGVRDSRHYCLAARGRGRVHNA